MGLGLRSIRFRVLAVFALSLAALTGALGYGLVQIRNIGEGIEAVRSWLPLAAVANELEVVARLMDREEDRLTRDTEPVLPLAAARSNVAFHSSSMDEALTRGREAARRGLDRVHAPAERMEFDAALTLLDEVDALRRDYVATFDAWADALDRGDAGERARLLARLNAVRAELVLKCGLLGDMVEGRIAIVSAQTARAQTRALAVGGSLAGLSVLFASLLAYVALVTLRPIARLTAEVQRLGAGDHSTRVDVRADDEVGVLAREFNAMAEAVEERDRRLKERARALDRLSEHLRRVIDTIRAGIVVVEEGRVTMANPAARRLWGVRVGEPLPPALGALAPGRYEAASLGDRLVDVEVVPFGEAGALVVGEDVTERVRDRERLARSERLALVGQMLAQITHEVRNPLNAISLNAELLAEDLAATEHGPLLETITAEIRRLEQHTARYLDLSRGREPEITPADPLRLAEEVAAHDAPALARAGLRVEIAGDPPRVVELDADALRRALRNLLRNAAEAGATTARVEVRHLGDRVRVVVSDDGPGLPAEAVQRVFEPFYTTKARGTGLGLAISRQELEDIGGSIVCHSEPGRGTVFTIEVPVRDPDLDGLSSG